MLFHYFKIAYRSLLKYKSYSLINLVGLTLGLAAGILITLYVLDELSYDKFHTNGDRLYRVSSSFSKDTDVDDFLETNAWPVGDVLRREFPETEMVLYTRRAAELIANLEGKMVNERVHYASPEVFKMFSFPLIEGHANTALDEPFTIVISENMKAKYFPNDNALNNTITFNDTIQFRVTGVMKNIPSNSHIQTEMVASFATFEKLNPYFSYTDGWGNFNMRNYVLLKEGADATAFKAKIKNIYTDKAGEQFKQWGVTASLHLEPFTEIYLHSKAGNGFGPAGNINTVYLLGGVGIFVILLACINFINLATARSVQRAKEVGVKKVVGSSRTRLIAQFLGESLIITIISFGFALIFITLFLPAFNELLGKTYALQSLFTPKLIIASIFLTGVIALCSGYYPALVLSAFRPVEILKGKMHRGSGGAVLRRTLVVVQFTISVSLVAGTIVVLDQLEFMQRRDLGFTRDEVFVVSAAHIRGVEPSVYTAFLNDLKAQSLVKNVTRCNSLPSISGWRGQVAFPEGQSGNDAVSTHYIAADENYLATLDLTLAAGRNFDPARPSDDDALIINESAVSAFGWGTPENAIGKKITSPSGTPAGTVIGVVKDYHDQGLQNKVSLNAIDFNTTYSNLYAIRYTAADTKTLIETLETVWRKYFPENEFNYSFLSETFARQYDKERRIAKVFAIFSSVTILIAVIGLFGLVSFLVASKTKEICVRKVLGANVWSIARLLSTEFILLVLLSNIIAFPLILSVADSWLQRFAFHVELSPMVFIVTALVALSITAITISFHTFRAALTNPATTLRYE